MSDPVDPFLVKSMRSRLSHGRNQEVRIVNSKGEPLAGTSIRTFLAEYDEAMQNAHEAGYAEAVKDLCQPR